MQGNEIEMFAPALIMVFLIAGMVGLALNILFITAFCKICSKAGYHWAMGLLMLVPIGNIILILVLGFGRWPIYDRMQQISPGYNPSQQVYQ